MKEAVGLFFAMATQWRWTGAGMGGVIRTGLDYSALPTVVSATGITMTATLFDDIRTLELAALSAWTRKHG
jgi:hypothetical protein